MPADGCNLRYFSERVRTAEIFSKPTSTETVGFGTTVTFKRSDGRVSKSRIVGEDEADPKTDSTSFVSPVARLLTGKVVGDIVDTTDQEFEITAIIDPFGVPLENRLARQRLASDEPGKCPAQGPFAILRALSRSLRPPAGQDFTQIADRNIHGGREIDLVVRDVADSIVAQRDYFCTQSPPPNHIGGRMSVCS